MAKNRVFELYFEQIYEAIKIVKDKLSEISIEEIYSTEDNLEKIVLYGKTVLRKEQL